MINQRGIIRAPEFVLPRPTIKSSRTNHYRRVRTKTIGEVWYDIPIFYKSLVICVTTIVLGTAVGAITPWLTQALGTSF